MDYCESLGAQVALNYKSMNTEQMIEKIKEKTGGKGIDIILDCVGPSFYNLSHSIANIDAKWV